MEKKVCENCAYFHQHYGLDAEKIFRVYCGHCTHGRVRRKRPDTMACEAFIERKSGESAFVSKEFLSKELLKYMMELELLPPIENGAETL